MMVEEWIIDFGPITSRAFLDSTCIVHVSTLKGSLANEVR